MDPTRIMIYGEAGMLKTRIAATFPSPYFFDFDDGLLGLDVPHDTYQDYEGIPDAYKRYKAKVREMSATLPDAWAYDTIVIDSLTFLDVALVHQIAQTGGHMETLPGLGLTTKLTLPDYDVHKQRMISDLQALSQICCKRLKCHFIMTAHIEVIKVELTGAVIERPLCTGQKFPAMLAGFFDEFWRTEMHRMKEGNVSVPRVMIHTRPSLRSYMKSRLGLPEWVEPSYEAIAANIGKGYPGK